MLCIMQALCNFTSRVLATSEVSVLFQRQIKNVVEKTQALLQENSNAKHAKEGRYFNY